MGTQMDAMEAKQAWARAGDGGRAVSLSPQRASCAALVAAVATILLSANPRAAEIPPGIAPAQGYASAEAAFSGAFRETGLAERAYRENREYAAAIYRMPDGLWYCTPVQTGSRTESSIPYHLVPEAALQVAGAHTHGQETIPEDPQHRYGVDFSQADLNNALHNYRITHGRIAMQLLLTSELRVLRLTITGQPDLAIGAAFVSSSEEARRTPGAIHAMTERIGRWDIGRAAAAQFDERPAGDPALASALGVIASPASNGTQ
jgi:hypothetical protein